MSENEHHDEAHDHGGHMTVYWAVFIGLLICTVLTVAVSKVHFGHFGNIIVAMAIAIFKATLVLTFFMHLRQAVKLIRLIAVGTFLWLSILLTYLIVDIDSRNWVPVEKGWLAPSTQVVAQPNH